ncbi:P-loop containing nucleoside triphosphate hydrolase protein [Epithele typhae]|uniref:P-loop containing nucleoside triphosphate hydrolase protein n=1 Tax=Epithele typhae TaxID=378194 RepID=UPI00200882B0|nr:P-loop containing nucleoside triphosphate hydrolase protein [Epithele typhae]KAH9921535.1 P-loop containing nucleoside triphosphate hydrolase protein [Epithele typhae]
MPRIRKKTSRRVGINQREKLKHKVKEGRRKKTREAKKNPQWKSKHKKDPGIPSAFPYKDQILAEVAEQRRVAAEEKRRRKDDKRGAQATDAADEGGDEEGSDAESDAGAAFDGVRAVLATRARMDAAVGPAGADEEEDEDEVPVLVNRDLPTLKAVIDAADVVVEVLDARDPAAARSEYLEGVVKAAGKHLVLVLSKVDACPREAVEAWAAFLRKEHPTLLFRAASACLPAAADAPALGKPKGKGKGKARVPADDAWGLDAFRSLLSAHAKAAPADRPLVVALVGGTNAGKSSFANALAKGTALETYALSRASPHTSTTTAGPQEVSVTLEGGREARIVDTPGWAWHADEDAGAEEAARARARDMLACCRGHMERVKDPHPLLAELVDRAAREDLMLLYNLPIFTEGDANAFLACLARANRFMKKKGDLDLASAARMVLRDWHNGKLARYTSPPPPPPSASAAGADADTGTETETETEAALAAAYAQNASVLARLATRKELRKVAGIVKLRSGVRDAREVVLDASYFGADAEDGGFESDEEDGGAVADEDEVGVDEDGEGSADEEDEEDEDEEDEIMDEDDEEEEESPRPRKGLRKRAAVAMKAPARPAKRVAFAAEPKGTKQARSAAGAKGAKAKATTSSPDEDGRARRPTKKPTKAAAKPVAPKKIANAVSSKSKKAAGTDGEQAYDFKQFF